MAAASEEIPLVMLNINRYRPEVDFPGGENYAAYMEAINYCLLYTSPSPRDRTRSRMPSSA